MIFAASMFAVVPWFFFIWLVGVKTPLPFLASLILGGVLLLRDRRTVASCFFLSLGVLQFVGLSLSGA